MFSVRFGAGLPDGLFAKPKIPFLVIFLGPSIGKCRNILWTFGIFCGHLGNFMDIWYILC
jgi:hypothetical protein